MTQPAADLRSLSTPLHDPAADVTGANATGDPRDVARLRRWYRRIERADMLAQGGWASTVASIVKAPARTAREAYRSVRRSGAGAREASGVSPGRQLARLWWLSLRHGINPDAFYIFQLFRDDRWPRAHLFVQRQEAARLYRLLAAHSYAAEAETLADKRRFAAWCAEQGLPTVPVLVEFDGGRITRDARDGARLPDADLFSKAASTYGGKGAARWRFVGQGTYEAEGRRLSAAELVAELAELSRDGPVVLQECQRNHHQLAGIMSGALGTVRIMTCRRPGRPPELLLAACRMAVGGAPADNFSRGGIVSAVDLEAGTLGPAVRPDERLRIVSFARHPDSGAQIAGLRLPFWPESKRLALRAHAALGALPFVGWDVALLEHGPVLLEGNWNPGVHVAQMPSGVPLGETAYAGCFVEHLDARLHAASRAELRAYSSWQPCREPDREPTPVGS